MQIKSTPELLGEHQGWRDGRYRLYTVEHIDFDTVPSYRDGGPPAVVVDGYSVSTSSISRAFSSPSVVAADDGKYTLNLSKPIRDGIHSMSPITGFDKHELDGTRYTTRRDADRAAFEAGATAFMVFEPVAAKLGLPTVTGQENHR